MYTYICTCMRMYVWVGRRVCVCALTVSANQNAAFTLTTNEKVSIQHTGALLTHKKMMWCGVVLMGCDVMGCDGNCDVIVIAM